MRRNENIINWEKYTNLLQSDPWDEDNVNNEESVEDMINYLNNKITKAVEEAFELKRVKIPGNKIPAKIRKLMRRKKTISNQLLKSRCPIKINKLRTELVNIEKILEENYEEVIKHKEEKILPSIKEDPALFYSSYSL